MDYCDSLLYNQICGEILEKERKKNEWRKKGNKQ